MNERGEVPAAAGAALKKMNSQEQRQKRERKAMQLSRELREGESKFLRNRRGVVALSTLASASMALIALYQMGAIKHLPEPPLPHLDADKVDASAETGRHPRPTTV
jgi:hypothetical protein